MPVSQLIATVMQTALGLAFVLVGVAAAGGGVLALRRDPYLSIWTRLGFSLGAWALALVGLATGTGLAVIALLGFPGWNMDWS